MKKKNKKDEFKTFFKGHISLPITYDVTLSEKELDEQMYQAIKYYGDWQTKLKRITGKPRKYLIQIILKGYKGEKDHQKYKIQQADTFRELGGYIYVFAKEQLNEILANGFSMDEIDLKNSYAIVKA